VVVEVSPRFVVGVVVDVVAVVVGLGGMVGTRPGRSEPGVVVEGAAVVVVGSGRGNTGKSIAIVVVVVGGTVARVTTVSSRRGVVAREGLVLGTSVSSLSSGALVVVVDLAGARVGGVNTGWVGAIL
jgi:hypothetical protein